MRVCQRQGLARSFYVNHRRQSQSHEQPGVMGPSEHEPGDPKPDSRPSAISANKCASCFPHDFPQGTPCLKFPGQEKQSSSTGRRFQLLGRQKKKKSQTKNVKTEMLFKNDTWIESDICLEGARTARYGALPMCQAPRLQT